MIKTVMPFKRKKVKGYLNPDLSWLPNWENEDEYTHLSNASPEQLAWEFLRRNRDYRIFRLEADKEFNKDAALSIVKEKFGLDCLPPFPSEKAPVIKFNGFDIFNDTSRFRLQEISPNKLIIVYDLELPNSSLNVLNKEIKVIKKEKEIKNFRAQDSHIYIRYLRILDARIRDVKNEEIARVLYPNYSTDELKEYNTIKRIQDSYEAGTEMTDFRYRLLGQKEK